MRNLRQSMAVTAVLVATGCQIDEQPADEERVSVASEELNVTTTMRYEGSCAWLACASIYCGNPGCGGACSDTQPWVARPTVATINCGSVVRVCNTANGLCVNATVRDTSGGGVWEGNQAVFQAIGASYGDGTCGCTACTGITSCPGATYGWGQATVQITDAAANEVIVDDTSSGFALFGPNQYWFQAWIGYGSHMWWTFVNGTSMSNFARWSPVLLGAGNYAVYAYIPSNNATSQTATYRIYHNGANNYAMVNQNNLFNVWANLGTYYFASNSTEYVELGDNTGEAPGTNRKLGFDAVKFVKQ